MDMDDGLSRRHDESLVTDEDEFGGVSGDQSEKQYNNTIQYNSHLVYANIQDKFVQ